MKYSSKLVAGLLFVGIMLPVATPVSAQSAKPALTNAEIALYQGADRQQLLVARAKAEGELTIYFSARDLAPVIEAFTKKYQIKVKSWKSNGENVLHRVVSEARGGRFEVDLVGNEAVGMEALYREKMLQRARSPYFSDLMPQAIPAHGEWVGTTMDVFVQAYNTQKVSKDELPKTYQDLLDPRWKGRLGIEVDDFHWFATLVQALGTEKGTKLFRDIVATNGISVRKGHTLLVNLVGSGEIPLGLTIYDYTVEPLKQKGAPVGVLTLEPVIASFKGIGMLKKAPHPYSAMLFYDFLLNEGQKILADRGVIPVSSKIDVPLKKLSLKFIDPVQTLDMGDQWMKTYEDIITKNSK